MEPSAGPSNDREPPDPKPDPMRVPGMPGPLDRLEARRRWAWSRRGFLATSVAGAAGLVACAPRSQVVLPRGERMMPLSRKKTAAPAPTDLAQKPADPPSPPAAADTSSPEAALPWAKPRMLWAKAPPIESRLNPMLPVTCATVHHDGLEDLFWSVRPADVAARIERYRLGHIDRQWADIGYHLVIDRTGVLWQGRSIRWQGAHVHLHNEGNIGILVMGNFDLQRPTAAQLVTLRRALSDLRETYRIARGRIYTHQEWQDAQTACPGRNLQSRMNPIRRVVEA